MEVPLSPEEGKVFKKTASLYRMLVDSVQLVAGDGECAAFFHRRSVLVPCQGGASPVRWASRGGELEPLARAFEARHALPPVPLPQVAQVVSCRGSWWVLEQVTAFDAGTGEVTHRDRVRRVAKDGKATGDILLGEAVMGIATWDSRLYALTGNGSSRALSVEP